MSPIASAALKVGVATGAAAIVLVRTRNLPREEMGFVRPEGAATLLFVFLLLAWMLATDAIFHWRGPWDFRPWAAAPLLASILRVLAVGFIGPTAEELIFRAYFFHRLRRLGPVAQIAITAIGWALLHQDYSWTVISIIAVDGLLLGLARWRTGSVLPPIVMHISYNLYAIW